MNLWTVGCADPRLTAPARSPMDGRENAMCFPRLAHRSAAAHKLHSTPQHRMKCKRSLQDLGNRR